MTGTLVQALGALLIFIGLALWNVAIALVVLGAIVLLFGVAVELGVVTPPDVKERG